MKYARELSRLAGRRMTQEDLLALFEQIYRRAYNAGLNAKKHGRTPVLADVA